MPPLKQLDQDLENLGILEDALLGREASEAAQLAQLQTQLAAKNQDAKSGQPINLDAEESLVQTLINKANARLGPPASSATPTSSPADVTPAPTSSAG